MELIAMALILTAVLVGQYFLYKRLGLKDLGYSLTIRRRSDGKSDSGIVEAFEGEELEFIEEIDNAKLLPLPWVRSEISCSRWLSFYGGAVSSKDVAQKGLISGIFTLRGRQKCRRTWRVRCEKRGVFTVEDISLTVSDLKIDYTPETSAAVDSLYMQQLDIRIFADEFFRAAIPADSL